MRSGPKLLLVVFLLCGAMRADLGLILSEPLPSGFSKWTQSGHSAVYLSNVCADSPLHLRLCYDGENGAVISNYSDFKEDLRVEWNAVPLNVFLYGVEDASLRPLYASRELRLALQQRFRTIYLHGLCSRDACLHDLEANWRDLVAERFVRGIYIFEVKTSLEQDERFIAEFNSRPNVNRYSGFRNNCANFALRVVNFYFPHAAHGDRLNDFGVVSPKGISRSFAHYAARHKELNYRVLHLAQMPGDFPASAEVRSATELAFRSKRFILPMLWRTHEFVLFSATYLLTGRFNPQKEFEHHAASAVGAPEQWNAYRSEYEHLLSDDAELRKLSIPKIAEEYDQHAAIDVDSTGSSWVQIPDEGGARRVGLDASNVLSTDSDHELAYRVLLAKAAAELKSSARNRESLADFERDWKLLQQSQLARGENASPADNATATLTSNQQ